MGEAAEMEAPGGAGETPPLTVWAELNYVDPAGGRPLYLNDDHYNSHLPLEPHRVEICDAAQRSTPPRLDVEGFEVFRCPTALRHLADAAEADHAPYCEEIAAFVRDVLGADSVNVYPRQATRRQARQGDEILSNRHVADYIHSDASPAAGLALRALVDEPSMSRSAIFNFWRLLSPGPTNLPLAVLDARTVAAEDIVYGDTSLKDRSVTAEMVLLRYNPAHRWYFYSNLGYDDLLVFKQWNIDTSRPWMTPHTAFHNAATIPAAPRISREARAMVFWR